MSKPNRPEGTNHHWGISPRVVKGLGPEFGSRHIITHLTRVSGGVDIHSPRGGIVIVVDPEKYPDEYERLREESLERAKGTLKATINKGRLPRAVYDTIRDNIAYSNAGVTSVERDVAMRVHGTEESQAHQKVELSEFLAAGVGQCRHMGLAAAILLEMHVDAGLLRGKASVERSIRTTEEDADISHQWARYTAHTGEALILDPAQKIYGYLEDFQPRLLGTIALVDSNGRTTWIDYRRPEEQGTLQTNPESS